MGTKPNHHDQHHDPDVRSLALFFTQFSTISVLITLAIWGIATWTTTPAKQFYLISLKPQASETVLSFNTAIMNIGMMLGSSMGGVIIQYTNVTNLSWIGGLASFVALMLIRYSFYLHVRAQLKTLEDQ